jgi:hypothetical protein
VNSKQRIAIVLSALAVLVTLLVVVPVFGADATQRFPNPADTTKVVTWVKQGGNVLLEVTDADLNTGADTTIMAYAECTSQKVIQYNRFTTSSLNVVTSSEPIAAPILDRNGDGVVSFADVVSSNANLQVESVDAVNGAISVRCTTPHGNDALPATDGTHFTLTYKKGAVERTAAGTGAGSVKVTSDADAAGISVRLEETTASSGVFRGTLRLRSAASTTNSTCLVTTASECTAGDVATAPIATSTRIADNTWSIGDLKVNKADTVVVTYVDGTTGATINRTVSIKVESTAPTFSNQTPANGASSTELQPTVRGDVTDADSGVTADTVVTVIIGRDTDANGVIDANEFDVVAAVDKTAITGGINVRQRIVASLATDQTVYWWIKAADGAGNNGVSDRETVDALGAANPCNADAFSALGSVIGLTPGNSASVLGCQPYSIKIDRTAPTLATVGEKARTGSFWDTSKTTTDKTNNDPAAAKNTSIRVEFTEALDAATVTASDFRVAGSTPLSAEVFAGAPTSVFLTVGTLTADQRPKVEVVSVIKDIAGNDMVFPVSVDPSTDGIAPGLTVAVGTAARPVTNTKVTIAVTSNENATNLSITTVQVGTLHTAGATSTPLTFTGGPKVFNADASPAGSGLYSVRVTASDLNSAANVGAAGGSTVSATSLTGLILFEVDKALPAPNFLPLAAGVDDVNAVVSMSFVDEGLEYGVNAQGALVGVGGGIVIDLDSYNTVTITKATLDGTDITSMVSSVDNIQFLYKAPRGLSVGSHVLVVEAKDVAGNAGTFKHTFNIKERASFKLPLNPGWNMVSFPGDPANAAIDAVIGSTPVTVVMAYDPSSADLWKVATRTRNADGKFTAFTGSLTKIDAKLGYWVLTDTFQAISTVIPRIAGGTATFASGGTPVQPPTIAIVKGWNLVPVFDTTGDLEAGANVGVCSYLRGITWSKAYHFDTQNGKWVSISVSCALGADFNISVGKSYWVYATASGTLVP